jgi:hypothetical protein
MGEKTDGGLPIGQPIHLLIYHHRARSEQSISTLSAKMITRLAISLVTDKADVICLFIRSLTTATLNDHSSSPHPETKARHNSRHGSVALDIHVAINATVDVFSLLHISVISNKSCSE